MARPPHHDPRGGFRNPWPDAAARGFPDVLRWAVRRRVRGVPPDPDPSMFARVAPSFRTPRADDDALTVTWVGHSTALIQIAGRNVLTDPMWGERASPVAFAGPKRWVAPGIAFEALPPIDVVLLSHNHYDHLDDGTVRRLAARDPGAVWAVPLGLAAFVRARGVTRAHELDWWQEVVDGPLVLACTPAQHFSARGLGDRNRTLWASWCVGAPRRRVFFGGDTGYHPEFARIGARHGPFDVALLPIGAYEPRWFMRPVHMNAEEAVRAFADLHADVAPGPGAGPGTGPPRAVLVPVPWGTFKLTDEPMDEPPRRAAAAWADAGRDPVDLWMLRHGETREL